MAVETRTRAQLDHCLRVARTAVILAEDAGDTVMAEQARCECDRLLDEWNLAPEQA